MLLTETDDMAHGQLVKECACRVAWVNDHERFGLKPVDLNHLTDHSFDIQHGGHPVGLLIMASAAQARQN
jgi:hypothetical protein